MARTSDVLRLAAFAEVQGGGNPAGVLIADDQLPDVPTMMATAAAVGYSETVFAAPLPSDGGWRVRYFAPESEVSFCGHATIALGAALALKLGDGTYALQLNDSKITVEASKSGGGKIAAALQSPPTSSKPADSQLVARTLALFGLPASDLDARIPLTVADAGSAHLVVLLLDQRTLSAMEYELEAGRALMNEYGLTTIALLFAESSTRFCARCAFACVLATPTQAHVGAWQAHMHWVLPLHMHWVLVVQVDFP